MARVKFNIADQPHERIPKKTSIGRRPKLSSNSLVITPLDTNLVSAIIGLYFGGSLVKK